MKLKMAVLAFIFDLRHTWSAWMPTHGINKIWRSLRGRRAITSARTRVSRPVPRTWLKIYMLTWTPLDVPLLKPFTVTIISFYNPTSTLKTQSLNHKPQHNIKNRTRNMRRSHIFTFHSRRLLLLHMSTCYQMRTALIQSNIMHMTVCNEPQLTKLSPLPCNMEETKSLHTKSSNS